MTKEMKRYHKSMEDYRNGILNVEKVINKFLEVFSPLSDDLEEKYAEKILKEIKKIKKCWKEGE